jgi:hypothetical protein
VSISNTICLHHRQSLSPFALVLHEDKPFLLFASSVSLGRAIVKNVVLMPQSAA